MGFYFPPCTWSLNLSYLVYNNCDTVANISLVGKDESRKGIKIPVTHKRVSLFLSVIRLKLHLKTGKQTKFTSMASAGPPHVREGRPENILTCSLWFFLFKNNAWYILSNWIKYEDATMHQRKATNCFVIHAGSGWLKAWLALDYYWPVHLGLQLLLQHGGRFICYTWTCRESGLKTLQVEIK